MRKNFMKYLACALVAVMLLGTTAFAATTTTTQYTISDETITVSTKVTGGFGADEQVTYLVYQENGTDSTSIDDDEIIYINQKTADDAGLATFTYKVAKGEALPSGSRIISGSTNATGLAEDYATIDPDYVVIKNGDGVTDADYTLVNNAVGTEETATLTIANTTKGTYTISGGNYDNTEITGSIELAAGEYTLNFEAEENLEPSIVWDNTSAAAGEYITVFATFTNGGNNPTYGVKFTLDGVVYDCKAVNNVDGKFAIKLADTSEDGSIITNELEASAEVYLTVDGSPITDKELEDGDGGVITVD